jgi:hypothetical protein
MTLTGGYPARRSAASATANFSERQTRGSVSAATLHGDFEPAGENHFRDLSSGADGRTASSE